MGWWITMHEIKCLAFWEYLTEFFLVEGTILILKTIKLENFRLLEAACFNVLIEHAFEGLIYTARQIREVHGFLHRAEGFLRTLRAFLTQVLDVNKPSKCLCQNFCADFHKGKLLGAAAVLPLSFALGGIEVKKVVEKWRRSISWGTDPVGIEPGCREMASISKFQTCLFAWWAHHLRWGKVG